MGSVIRQYLSFRGEARWPVIDNVETVESGAEQASS
jgi:hypothetical protein